MVTEVPGADETCDGGEHRSKFPTAGSTNLTQDDLGATAEVAGKSVGTKVPSFQPGRQPANRLPDVDFAVDGFRRPIQWAPANVSWFAGQSWHPGSVMGHHYVAPWNTVWCDGTLVGSIDRDIAGLSSRTLDLALAALTWAPLPPRTMVASQGFTAASQGFTAFDDRPRRLHPLLDTMDTTGHFMFRGERRRTSPDERGRH